MKNAILTGRFSFYGIVGLLVALSMLFTPFVSADLSEGLILYHMYDEGEGTLAADASGNGHDGEISNPDWVDGKFGKALQFGGEGSDVFVTVESTPALNVNECTFGAWINADHWNGTRQIVGKSVHGGCAGRTQYGLFSEGGVFRLRLKPEVVEPTLTPIFRQQASGFTLPLPTMVKPQQFTSTLRRLRTAQCPMC